MRVHIIRLCVAAVLVASTVFGSSHGASAFVVHSLTYASGCTSPMSILSRVQCDYLIVNALDTDTLTVTSVTEVVHGAAGADVAGNVLPLLSLRFDGGAHCDFSQTHCFIPPGGRIATGSPFQFHTATPEDADTANPLTVDTQVTWQDTCDSQKSGCPIGDQFASSGGQSVVQKLGSSTDSQIHDADHHPVTAILVGSTVHDFVVVSAPAGQSDPTGTVFVDWFTNLDCSGTPAANSADVATIHGVADVTAFPQTPAPGQYSFLAHYRGDELYHPSDGGCEPLTVVDGAISIDRSGAAAVRRPQTFTVRVSKNDGSGWAPATGVAVDYTVKDTNGAVHDVTPNPPTTCDGSTDANGSCAIVLTSATAGTVIVNARVALTLEGLAVTRDTDPSTDAPPGPGGSGPAKGAFVDARIGVDGSSSRLRSGQTNVLTVHVQAHNGGPSGYVDAPDGTKVTVGLKNVNGATATVIADNCASTGLVGGTCTVSYTSATPGRVDAMASVTLRVAGVILRRDTDPSTGVGHGVGGTGPFITRFF